MPELLLFTDASVNTKLKIGYGAFLAITDMGLAVEQLKKNIKTRRFEQTSSTKLELQTLLWALKNVQALGNKVTIYTDSQNILGLLEKRERLEQNAFLSRKNLPLRLAEMYQEFYRMTDLMDCQFVKVQGHQKSNQKNDIDRLFTLVDRAARKALRKGPSDIV